MRVVVLQGSPRRKGNTETVTEWVLAGLSETSPDAEVVVVRVADKKISGCIEDFACQAVADAPGCPIEDDMGEIYALLMTADVVVISTPVFCWGVTAQLKCVLDRLYATIKFNEMPPRSLLAGKKMALIVTSGGPAEDGANLIEAMFDRLVGISRSADLGRLICPLMTTPQKTARNDDLKERARQFGANLTP